MDSKEFPISGTAGPPGPKVEVILQKEQMNHDNEHSGSGGPCNIDNEYNVYNRPILSVVLSTNIVAIVHGVDQHYGIW